MSFLKKNFIWIVLAAVLAGEGFFTYVLFGKQAEVEKATDKLDQDVKQLGVLRNQTSNFEERLAILQARQEAIEDERGECTLFLWARDQAMERFFDAPELKSFKPTPWSKFPPDTLGLFRLAYQKVYDSHVAALADVLKKTRTGRLAASFVGLNEFTKQNVTLGDIYQEQKDFWVRKAVVEIAAAAGIKQIEQIAIQIPVRPVDRPGHPAPRPTNTSDIEILIRVQGTYRSLQAFLEGMSESELGFRVKKVVRVNRMLIGAEAAKTGGAGTPKSGEEKTVVPPTQGVGAEVYFTLPDSNVEINTITFPAAAFPNGKEQVKTWLTGRIAQLKRDAEKHSTATSPRVGTTGAAAADESKNAPVTLTNELIGGGRDYTFESAKEANEYLSKVPQLEVVRLAARLALWERALALLNEGERVSADGDIVINVRPEEHLTKKGQRYTFVVDRMAGVELDFGLLTFAPNVSGTVAHGSRTE